MKAASLLLLCLFFCFPSFAQSGGGGSCELTLARLKYSGGGDWYANPSALPNLAKALRERTSLPVCDTVADVDIMDPGFFACPFISMTGHGTFALSPEERLRLRKYLAAGGLLWADDNFGLDSSFRKEMALLFPDHPLAPLPNTHPIFSAKYPLKGLPKIHEHDGGNPLALGIVLDGKLVVLYTFDADIGDGMEDPDVHKDGPDLHEKALEMGINIVQWFFGEE